MTLKDSLLGLFGVRKTQAASKVTDSNGQQQNIQRMHHRGYLIENATGATDNWKSRINNKVVTGDLAFIKKSIDWWCDKKAVLAPESANRDKSGKKREVVIHHGFKIINDTGEPNEWYMIHNGKLFKGSKKAIEAKIENAIQQASKRSNKSVA